MRRPFSVLATLALLAGCAGPDRPAAPDEPATAPAQGGAPQVTVELTPAPPTADTGAEPNAEAEGAEGGAVVRGTLTAPTPCHLLSGAAERSGDAVVLRVSARPDPDAMCADVIASLGYTAVLRGLPAGETELRVVHDYPGSGWDEQTVLETRVAVR